MGRTGKTKYQIQLEKEDALMALDLNKRYLNESRISAESHLQLLKDIAKNVPYINLYRDIKLLKENHNVNKMELFELLKLSYNRRHIESSTYVNDAIDLLRE